MHVICKLYACYMHVICMLYASYMQVICMLYACYMHVICMLYASYMPTASNEKTAFFKFQSIIYRISSNSSRPSNRPRLRLDRGGNSIVSEIQRALELTTQFN